MQRDRVTRGSQAAMMVGWVSTADALFVGLILTLTITLFVAARLQHSEATNRQMRGTVDSLQGQLDQSQSQLGQIQGRVADLQAERERLIQLGRRHIQDLNTQLSSLQSQYAAEKCQREADKEKLKADLAAWHDYYLAAEEDPGTDGGRKAECGNTTGFRNRKSATLPSGNRKHYAAGSRPSRGCIRS